MILDDITLACPGYMGDQQYVSVGNETDNDQVLSCLVAYQRGRRLQIWGHDIAIDNEPRLIERVLDPTYPANIEGVIRIDIKTQDLAWRQRLPKPVPKQSLDQLVTDCDARVAAVSRDEGLLAWTFIHE